MKVPVTIVIHHEIEVPDDWDGGTIAFYVEENHCISNYIEELRLENVKGPRTCNVCHRANAFVGHIPFKSIRP